MLRLAGANSLDIALVREKAHEAYAGTLLADEKFWPVVGPGAALRWHNDLTQATNGTFVDVEKRQAFGGFQGRVQWQPGDALFSKLSSMQRLEAGLHAVQAVEHSAVLDAALAYFELFRETLRARVAEEAARISEKLAGELEASLAIGRAFRGDLLRARVQLAGNRLALARAQEAIKVSGIRLGAILRLPPEVEMVCNKDVPQLLALVDPGVPQEQVIREALRQRPEIKGREAELAAAKHDQTGATWGALIPDVTVEASGGRLGPTANKLGPTQDVAVFLGWRIGPGGLFDAGRQHLADARVGQAEIELEKERQRVTAQVRTAWTGVRAKAEQIKIAEQALKDAEETLALDRQRQSTGVGIPLEVLQAEEALTRVRLDYFTSILEYNQSQLRLYAYRGGGLLP